MLLLVSAWSLLLINHLVMVLARLLRPQSTVLGIAVEPDFEPSSLVTVDAVAVNLQLQRYMSCPPECRIKSGRESKLK